MLSVSIKTIVSVTVAVLIIIAFDKSFNGFHYTQSRCEYTLTKNVHTQVAAGAAIKYCREAYE